MFFGGERLFFTSLSGTRSVLLQSLPFSRMADRIFQHAPSAVGSQKGEGVILEVWEGRSMGIPCDRSFWRFESVDKKESGSDKSGRNQHDMDRIVSEARKSWHEREIGYREQSLKIHPWVCARCGREFTRENLHLLTVHHRDHNHDNNPPDGSNWENLCLYCHENEHSRYLDHSAGGGVEMSDEKKETATYKPFAGLKDLLKSEKE